MRNLSVSLLSVLFALSAAAQVGFSPDDTKPPKVELNGSVSKRTGNDVQGAFSVTIPAPWHVNSNKPLDEFLIPTVLTVDPATADVTSITYPQHELKSFAFSGGSKLA